MLGLCCTNAHAFSFLGIFMGSALRGIVVSKRLLHFACLIFLFFSLFLRENKSASMMKARVSTRCIPGNVKVFQK